MNKIDVALQFASHMNHTTIEEEKEKLERYSHDKNHKDIRLLHTGSGQDDHK